MSETGSRPRSILHADMDAFYASVEQRDRPELRGRPVVVGGTGRRGVVSSASYEARPFGVRSAMPTGEAQRLCPHAVFLSGDMARYARESGRIFAIFRRFTPQVEGLSLDEAFLDLTGSERLLAPLPVSRLWGVGPVAEERLRRAGFHTLGDLAGAAPERVALLGDAGPALARMARGEDARNVDPHRAAVSISEEHTFADDVSDPARLEATALAHAEAVARRLRRAGLRARTVVLKLKLARRRRAGPRGFDLLTRRATLAHATDDGAVVADEARRLLARAALAEPVRLLGVGVTNLVAVDAAQPDLFEGTAHDARRARLNRALDALAERYGKDSVVRAGAGEVVRAGLSLQIKRGE